ncbi:MAG: hypothetical protein WCA46_19530, partial [Actinocatenispora sp.]
MTEPDLWQRAVDTLRGNRVGRITLPAPHQYPHQWSWDSAFIAIGLAHCDPAAARAELLSLFAGQWPDGRVPQIVYNPEAPDTYFPGPDFWRSPTTHGGAGGAAPRTSGLVQPPMHARAALRVYQVDPAGSVDFLRRLYPKLVAWHRYLGTARDVGGGGLAAIVHPWESGLDNSPLWDAAIAAAGPFDARPFTRHDVTHVGAAQRPTDTDYRAYIGLAAGYRDTGCDDGALSGHRFVVEDPLFNAVLLDAELCLARIAGVLGADRSGHEKDAHRVHRGLTERLWNGDRFTSLDVRTGGRSDTVTVGCLTPLLDPWLDPDVRRRLVDVLTSVDFLGCGFPVPSTAVGAPAFDPHRYWRGPTWINTNWLIWLAARAIGRLDLADRIAESGLALVGAQGFREYYGPLDGAGLGARDFSWSAALTLDWLASGRNPPPPS